MIKLTLSFKGRPLSVHPFEGPTLIVGRDPDCDIVIDSLAVAPRHARLHADDSGVTLHRLDDGYQLLCNGRQVESVRISEGARILVGKHTLTLDTHADETVLLPLLPEPSAARPSAASGIEAPAYIQIQGGQLIGEIIHLTRSVVRLTRIGGDEVIVTRREHGYCLARIGEANLVYVGREAVEGDTEVTLANGVEIEIDGVRCQFFGPDPEPDPEPDPKPSG